MMYNYIEYNDQNIIILKKKKTRLFLNNTTYKNGTLRYVS